MATDIIVIGHRDSSSTGTVTNHSYNFMNNNDRADANSYDSGVPQNPTAGDVTIKVNVSIDNPANQEKAIEAAKNVADAVATIIVEASKLPPSTVIPLPNGKSITAGILLFEIKRTKFVITDRPLTNDGVGSADRTTMTDTLHFASFANVDGVNGYATPGYNGQGIIGTILHEISHMTSEGYANYTDSVRLFNRENAERKLRNVPFYGSDYAKDNEMFAHYAGISAAAALNINVGTYNSLMSGGIFKDLTYRGPQMVYNERRADGY